MVNLFASVDPISKANGAVTMSAGNAGKSFSYLTDMEGIKSTVVMPTGVPQVLCVHIYNKPQSVGLLLRIVLSCCN